MTNTRYNVNIHNDEEIASKVDMRVPEELISSRSSGQNSRVSYIKGDVNADRLNEIFGPLAWSLAAGSPKIERFEDKRTKWEKPSGGGQAKPRDVDMVIYAVTTQVTLTIKARSPESTDTVFTQTGVGYGEVEVGKHAKDAIGMAVKGAETDGFKRCTTMLGKAFGLFLNADGSQSDIEYAHRNDNASLTKAKKARTERENRETRQSRENSPANHNSQNERAPRGENQDSERSREPAAATERKSEARQEETKRSETRQEQAGNSVRQNTDSEKSRQDTNDAPSEKKSNRPSARVNENFDLDSEPVTRDDQIAFGATFIKKFNDTESNEDRLELVRKHRKTMSNFDSNIYKRVKSQTERHGIDIDKVQ